jgi:2-oxoglutarate ferredoxin oxidoreductase subunit alpha
MMDKRMRKVESLVDALPAGRRWGAGTAAVGVIGTGMELGPMLEASERLAADGVAVDWLQPRTLWPVPPETLEFIARHDRVHVIEHNAEGQLAHILASAGADRGRLCPVLRYDGRPFSAGELVDRILDGEARSAEARSAGARSGAGPAVRAGGCVLEGPTHAGVPS